MNSDRNENRDGLINYRMLADHAKDIIFNHGRITVKFFITLNKSDKDYSLTTMYNDYSLNEILFHWQSQSTTSDKSPTGQRYIHHKEREAKVVICVREFKNDAAGAAPYLLLRLCDFVKYEGSRPMNIT